MRLNRKKNVAIEIKDQILYVEVDGRSICKQPLDKMNDIGALTTLMSVLRRAEVLII